MVAANGMYNNVAAIVFDFDGVIVESADIKTEAFLALFDSYPEHRDAIRDYHLAHQGISRYAKFDWIYRELLCQPLTQADSVQLGAAFSDIVFKRVVECPLVPGAQDLLQSLHGRIPMFVASGTPHQELEAIIDQRGLSDYFAEIWGAPTEKSTAVRIVLERLELRPHQLLFVGDALSDQKAAVETEVRFLARYTVDTADQWQRMGVDSVPDLGALQVTLDGDLLSGSGRIPQEQS